MNRTLDKEKIKLKQLQKKNRDLIFKMNFCMAKVKSLDMGSQYPDSTQHTHQNSPKSPNLENCKYKSNTSKFSSAKKKLDKNSNENYSASTPKTLLGSYKLEKFQNNLKSVGNCRIENPVFSNKIQSCSEHLKNVSKSQKKANKVCFASDKKKKSNKYNMEKPDCSMLGYDWIAGMLDNDSYINEKSEEFFDELFKFRKTNKEDCTSDIFSPSEYSDNNLPTNLIKNESLPYNGNSYMVNNRLNFIPVQNFTNALSANVNSNFKSGVRVTIPKSACNMEYKVRSHRRKSFYPNDSVSLSMHCLAGWQNSKPLLASGPKNIDLKSHILSQTSKRNLKTR